MGSRRWSFVEEEPDKPRLTAKGFSIGYLATLAIIASAFGFYFH